MAFLRSIEQKVLCPMLCTNHKKEPSGIFNKTIKNVKNKLVSCWFKAYFISLLDGTTNYDQSFEGKGWLSSPPNVTYQNLGNVSAFWSI